MMILSGADTARFRLKVGAAEGMVVDFYLREQISVPFEANIHIASEDEMQFNDVIGKIALLTLESDDADRYVHGIVDRFVSTGMSGRFYLYQARMIPQVKLLSLEQDSRIFQQKSVPDIVKEVLGESGITGDLYDFRLQGSYAPREYCVQYRETDLNFISRLLEEEGIFYFFEHSKTNHLMVFGDGTVNYKPIPGEPRVIFKPGAGMVAEEEAVISFHLSRQIRSGKYTTRDFNFERPSLNLTADQKDNENERLEVYDYPGEYILPEDGRKIAQVRLQQAVMYKEKGEGMSVSPRFGPGFTFKLTDHAMDAFNREYLLVEVTHSGAQPQVLAETASGMQGTRYENEFMAVPSSITIRAEKIAHKPVVEGVQTAIVTGPTGEEIYTDKHGRVKVQFHWDRLGRNDDKSSCWIRVSQSWAGKGWGAMFVPRIGQEVIVDFIEGDPDRPIITGRVYHGGNMPPYSLPDEKTKSTLKSNSSLGGGGSNEIRFEDKKGGEEIYIHGQKDWTIGIENDKNQTIGHDETLSVKNNRTKTVDKNQDESIGGDKSISVGKSHTESISETMSITIGKDLDESAGGGKSVSVGKSLAETVSENATYTVGKSRSIAVSDMNSIDIGKDHTENIGKKMTLTIGEDAHLSIGKNLSIIVSDKTVINSSKELALNCGGASIILKSNGTIQIKGKDINITGSGNLVLKGSKISAN
jgi:type VI secretion system secreted protein VgrG